MTPPRREELVPLVAWAIRAALTRARLEGLPEDEFVSAALRAVTGAVKTYKPGQAPLAVHVRGRVRWALLDAAKNEKGHRERETLLNDLEEALPPEVEDDEVALGRAAGVEIEVLASPEAAALRREAQLALNRLVEELPRVDRRFYELHFREEHTWDEMTSMTGLSESTLRRRINAIREHLLAALRARFDAE